MEAMQPRHLLRILSGLHVGAEARLFDGELILGSDDGCDLILMDQDLLARHLKLTVSGHGVTAEALGKDVLLNGTALEGTLDLVPFQVITLGRVHLAVGPAQAEWPRIEIPGMAASPGELTDEPGPMEQEGPGNLPEPPPGGGRKGASIVGPCFGGAFFVPGCWVGHGWPGSTPGK